MTQIKLEEETQTLETDMTLLTHLDRKLGCLQQEQSDLIEASYDIKVEVIFIGDNFTIGHLLQASLTVHSEAQANLTKQLINKIGIFSDSQKGKT